MQRFFFDISVLTPFRRAWTNHTYITNSTTFEIRKRYLIPLYYIYLVATSLGQKDFDFYDQKMSLIRI